MSEFSRPIRIDTIGDEPRDIELAADAAERAALAARFDLPAIDRFTASVRIRRAADLIHAEGSIDAAVTQSCVATGVPLPATLAVPFTLRFAPAADLAGGDEVELDADDCDTIGHDGAAIDLGEAAAETLYLALDPFPRATDADETLKAAGVLGEADAGPFAALKGLRDKLAG